jgi:hypothetical protein
MKSRYIAGLGMVMMLGGRCLAQETAPPANRPPQYTISRWDEDYRYLRDPAARDLGEPRDFFDPIKYIPFNDKGDIYLSLGGQVRYRYEFFNDENFGRSPDDDNGYHLLRMMAHVDLHLGENFRLFVQGKSALIEDRDGGPRAIDADEIDIQQAFGDFSFRFNQNRDSVLVRLGRQDLRYGAERLIGVSDWTNVRRTFEGVRGSIGFGNNTLDLFWVWPVKVQKESLNEGDDNTNFAGIYDVISLPAFMRDANSKLDIYGLWLGRDNTNSSPLPSNDSDTYTVGAHFFSRPMPWDVDLEGDYQFGDSAGNDIRAWSFASEVGYNLTGVTWTPRLYIGFDIASGDDDPTDGKVQTFNQLFPTGHPYFGYIDVIGRQNIIDGHGGFSLALAPVAKLRLEQHFFWRQDTHDGLYTATGAELIPPGSSSTNYIGSEFDVLFDWQIDRHWSTYVGYSHFFAGDFVEESGAASGADNDIDFVYGALMFTF